ncbi:MAG: carboxypeptidase-like regulatory domain-containing protein, partial [Geopsychrobacter sp.]|nr:carboxypeptidase-like regulatory domain-containing protein [Geopsychrobacter sp.]
MKTGLYLLLLLLTLTLFGCGEQSKSAKNVKKELVKVQGLVVAPLEKASLYIYKKGMDLYGPAFAVSDETDREGHFGISLPEGEYVVVIRKRASGSTVGPVVAGDNRSEFIPLQVKKGMTQLNISAPIKIGDKRRLTKQDEKTMTGFSGQITDADGNPIEGLRIQVYDHVQMSERPKYVSEKTGPDGRYKMSLPQGGTYYIAARDNFGGPPKLGDLYGRYDQGT